MMTGKERMLAAFEDGCPDEIPNVLNNTGLSMWRGHFWKVFAEGKPWWIRNAWDIPKLLEVEEKQQKICDLDWIWNADLCPSREWRKVHRVAPTARAVYMVNLVPKDRREHIRQYILEEPRPDGSSYRVSKDVLFRRYGVDMTDIITEKEDVEKYITVEKAEELIETGKLDWIQAIIDKFGEEKFISACNDRSPFTSTVNLMGVATTLTMMIKNPELLLQIADRYADQLIEVYKAIAKIGADGTMGWEWVTGEMISPTQYNAIIKPSALKVCNAVKKMGIKYIYAPTGLGKRWQEGLESMLDMEPDAIQLEESVKGLDTDMAWQASLLRRKGLQDKVTIFGNIAAINAIQNSTTEELEEEVKRQIDIGREYGRFVMDAGAPITPETSFERLLEYLTLVRKYARRIQ
ncbi:MAG: hypothetical protein JSV20_04775 [Candidatus Bathyarchaeota archaeon]|nr:MAG: hypothetical protein JSV20_04775 [Candidatus Bathyarchaeota archaeon]